MALHVVFYSGGLMSWATAKRAIQAADANDRVVLLFTDTLIEDPDLYRFLAETTAAWDNQAEFIRIADGRTPFEVFRDERMLGNSRFDPCSRVLKRELSHEFVKGLDPSNTVLYIGYNWDEPHRLAATVRAYDPFEVRAPLMDPPYLHHDDVVEMLASIGIKQPRLYERGYAHNNCGGACVKAGQAAWAHLLKDNPDLYARWEAHEIEMQEMLERDVTILKRRVDGDPVRLSLTELRERVEADKQIDLFDWGGCACFVEPETEVF